MSFGVGPYGDQPPGYKLFIDGEEVEPKAVRSLKLSIAKAFDLPPELILPPESDQGRDAARQPDNLELYRKALGMEAAERKLVTSGGLCAPNAPKYALPTVSFIYLDQGTLDLGIVRDSVLQDRQNDFTVFTEAFEGDE